MYQLFCPYGNLLSVRIMVEKDTGRSRGFGFVSYDSSDAAALAIKELNGFPVSVVADFNKWYGSVSIRASFFAYFPLDRE